MKDPLVNAIDNLTSKISQFELIVAIVGLAIAVGLFAINTAISKDRK